MKSAQMAIVIPVFLVVIAAAAGCASQTTNSTDSSSPTSANTSTAAQATIASNGLVQPQPTAGSCHSRGSGLFSEPDPHCTPGTLNPAVTQQTINRTICISGWTETVRPPEAVTEQEKAASMAAYGDSSPMRRYEYDHLVSLELGGATNDPRNLWPEPGASPNPKDSLEDELHRDVCDRLMSLARAQHIIATEWVRWGRSHGISSSPTRA
jgi:hypothetical protein